MKNRPRGKRPIQEITEPQLQTFKEIRRFIDQRGFPPTTRDRGYVVLVTLVEYANTGIKEARDSQ